MNCIIIDDDSTLRLQLKEYLNLIGGIKLITEFIDAIEALQFLKNNNVDLIFLDVNLPHLSGVEFINSIKINSKIIMITSDASHAATVFGNKSIIDFITKPITFSRLTLALQKYDNNTIPESLEKKIELEEELFVYVDKKLVKLKYDDINYIEAFGDYVNFYLDKKTICVYSSLKNVKSKLNNPNFVQTHRSYIINLKKIDEIEDTFIVIKSKSIPVSRNFKPELLQKLNLL